MAALPLPWKAGEAYDLHVLRGGPSSKSLVNALQLPAGSAPATLRFKPQFVNLPGNFGVTVNEFTGEVSAIPPAPMTSRTEIHNFIITVSIQDSTKTFETEIRVYLHDQVTDIWLTPDTLTIHLGADECRFTVLARFSDGTVGDITAWPQLKFKSLNPATHAPSADVQILQGGVLKAVNPNSSAEVIATLELPPAFPIPFPVLSSPPVSVITRPSWVDVAKSANVVFVTAGLSIRPQKDSDPKKSGIVVPDKGNANGPQRDSVASVVANATNVLFVSEGFTREADFNKQVERIVNEARTAEYMQPYKLAQDAVNYWSVFIPSQEDGVTLLGDYFIHFRNRAPTGWHGHFFKYPRRPSASATVWTLEELIHEVGMPVPSDPLTLDAIKDLWKARYGDKPYKTLAANAFASWRSIAAAPMTWRTILNECDSAFGMSNFDRPRATSSFGEVMLGSNPRRTSDPNIFKFIENLRYGGHQLGATWIGNGKDASLVCFLCHTQRHAGKAWGSYFLCSTGRSVLVRLRSGLQSGGQTAMALDTPPMTSGEETLLPTVAMHELSHRLGLADEYGDGGGAVHPGDDAALNVMGKKIIVTTTPATSTTPPRTVYDKTTAIKWLWPRITKAAVLDGLPVLSGVGLKVPLRKGHGKPFKFGDLVRFRETPVRLSPDQDPFVQFLPHLSFSITSHKDDEVTVVLVPPGGTVVTDMSQPNPTGSDPRRVVDIFLPLFDPSKRYALICPRRSPGLAGGTELKLVPEKIRTHIASSHGPLNAPPGNIAGHEVFACLASKDHAGTMSPTNLPPGFTLPPALAAPADLIGVYEGGAGHDCGMFRPSGRCKMRAQFDATVPFCHVCRYLIVDRLDPTKHGELDALYDPVYPT